MISFKPGIELDGITSACLEGMSRAAGIFARERHDFVVTSVMDGVHKKGSRHHVGDAFDCRSHHLNPNEKRRMRAILCVVLGPDWDVLLEDEDTETEHFHFERDPKLCPHEGTQ